MRIRTIKPEFWISESVGRLSRDARLTFVGLWSLADDEGRFRATAPYIAGQLYAYDEDGVRVVNDSLEELLAEGVIQLYEVDGSRYGCVTGWRRHQKIDHPTPSRLPQPPEIKLARTREDSGEDQGSGIRDQGRDQGAGKGSGNREQGARRPKKKKLVSEGTQPELPAIPPAPPPPPPKPSWQQALYQEFVTCRWDYLDKAGLPDEDEPAPNPALVNTVVAAMVGDFEDAQRRRGVFLGMAEWFCQQPWGGFKDGKPRTPPWPWQMFCAEKVWRDARRAVEAADEARAEA